MAIIDKKKRELYERIMQAALANPFSVERHQLDTDLVGLPADAPLTLTIEKLMALVSAEVQDLARRGAADVQGYPEPER
ncbi:MAG TPA: hypothetical protein PKM88_08895, partial [bacterium]|nr:hypothetical protein [bacterium]